MRLDEFYTVTPDASCWTLSFEKTGPDRNDNGKLIISRSTSYHATLKQALVKYLDNALKPCEVAQTVLNRISEVEQMIERDVATITWGQIAEVLAETTRQEMKERKAKETK